MRRALAARSRRSRRCSASPPRPGPRRRLRARDGGRGPAAQQPAARRRRGHRLEASSASTSSASTRAGGRSRPARRAHASRAGFNAKDPDDRALRLGRARHAPSTWCARPGMRVMLTITGPGPLWARPSPASTTRAGCPSAAAYADFARAVATRYRTQVDRYLIWNEPNQQGWLQPQWQCDSAAATARRSRRTSTARWCAPPRPAIHAADPGSEVVMGELAPVGDPPISANTPIKPLIFMREMGCVDAAYRTVRTGRCKGFKAAAGRLLRLPPAPAAQRARQSQPGPRRGAVRRPLAAVQRARQAAREEAPAGQRQHPPDRVRLPDQPARQGGRHQPRAADDVPAAGRLRRLEDQARARAVLLPVGRRAGVNRGSGTKRYSGWQTGLRFNNGKPKPVLSTFPAPFVIERKGKAKSVRLWGQVRPDADRDDRRPDRGPRARRTSRTSRRSRPRRRHLDVRADDPDGRAYRYSLDAGRPRSTAPQPLRARASGQRRPRRRPRSRAAGGLRAVTPRATTPRRSTPRATRSRTARRACGWAAGARWARAPRRPTPARCARAPVCGPERVVEIGCGDGSLLLELARGVARRALRRLRALRRRRSRSPAVAASRAPAGSRPMTARASLPRTARTTSRCSRTCSSTCPTRRRCWRGGAGRRATCSSRCRSRTTAPPRGPPSAPRRRGSGTCTRSTAPTCARS